jgi:glycosyltransferase involved in cell wall biosynthesis
MTAEGGGPTPSGMAWRRSAFPVACVVIPAYHEAAHIADVVRDAAGRVDRVLVVDDGSTDGTAELAREAGADVLRHDINRGKGAALANGLHDAEKHGFDVAITLDGDGQHPPRCIPDFLAAYASTRVPVLVGNRMADPAGMPWIRRLTNRFMSWLISREMGQSVPDTQCGYRLFAREVLPHVPTVAQGFAAESEVLLALGARGIPIGAVPVPTIYGEEHSKIHPLRDTFRFFGMLRRWRRTSVVNPGPKG